eukprot:CAMPEP_0197074976 /NCGR_PEP_ID=MMETSP1384-20130603/211379_1 /TAXON_ID=29189 /ORGANISM="Ammonia sp." /LENGTH=694 /DNA_ID=CAMNT_0042513819 /DNA_START=94 /DNA_END=2178 /DNA_ORIENTATION=-
MTYQQIGYFAFGINIQHIITFLIWCLTYLASIGYCVLVGDLIKPIVCYIGSLSDGECSSEWLRRVVIAGGILCVAPFCYMRQIKALKYTSIMSIASVIMLAVIIAAKSASNFGKEHIIYFLNDQGYKEEYRMSSDVRLWPDSMEDVIYVFPVFGLSFMCHFNIPQVHSELTRPTRKRMRTVLVAVCLACYVLYSVVAFFGYFYSFQYTCGNVLLNYNQNDPVVTLARLCLGFVILFTFPLLILPARGSMHNLLNLVYKHKSMNLEDNDFALDSEHSDSRSELSMYDGPPTATKPDSFVAFIQQDQAVPDEQDEDILQQSLLGAPATEINANAKGAINGHALLDADKNAKNSEPIKVIQTVKIATKTNKELEENPTEVANEDDTENDTEHGTKNASNKKSAAKHLQIMKTRNKSHSSNSRRKSSSNASISSSSSHDIDSPPRVPLTYNTFNTNPTAVPNNNISNNSATNKLLTKKPKMYLKASKQEKDESGLMSKSASALLGFLKSKSPTKEHDEREHSVSSKGTESVSRSRLKKGFMTRSFSNIDSPLRGPQDALGVINNQRDAMSLKDKEFVAKFKNLESAKNFTPTNLWLIMETTLMIGLSLLVSFLTESVMVVWGIAGSTVTFIIAFTLPGMFYVKIRRHKGWTLRNVASVLISVISTFAIVLCTWQALARLDVKPCPNQPPLSVYLRSNS